MSYCRVGEFHSDVYVIRNMNGALICFCDYPGGHQATEQGMIDHLIQEHRERLEIVPQRAIDRLVAERDGIPYKTDVQIALEEFKDGDA